MVGTVRVVIAEDSVLLREGLVRLLADEQIETVATVGDGPGLIGIVAEHRPDLAIVDVRMPPSFTDEGLRAALAVREQVPGTPILVLSQYVEERYATDLIGGGAEGVGYLLKERVAEVHEFIDAVRRIAAGGTVIDPEVIGQLLGRRRSGDRMDALTPREREVLGLMAQGRSNGAIARDLVVTEGAVEKHISNIFLKLDLPPAEQNHRRVMAVLAYLGRAEGPVAGGGPGAAGAGDRRQG
ncbi:response regulator transcription factor [Actinomadura alba]|uniref:Response regulator transcription factor n=1 Tax=Actinomadura alba TaxID=406431 RepID=A0ABR7LN00_9ACTN|nr:response regulator transcription factor [Actinomadura alba]